MLVEKKRNERYNVIIILNNQKR